MARLSDLYSPSLALLTDLYQLTMAYGYWKTGLHERESVFNLFFRRNPFGGNYAVACGLDHVVGLLDEFRFADTDVAYLSTLTGNDDQPLFEKAFLVYLTEMRFACDVDAMPEGTVAFPHQPLVRMRGPLIQCQILETPLLNMINFQTLIATKAARICLATQGEPVLEFGLRRAQGIDGALSASRAAYIGGCAATSNVLAGKLFNIPVRGTHAHAWVMAFDDELGAFYAYADAMPNNCVFLVDTYDTVNGVKNAIRVGHSLREKGHEMVGVRLDSGDMADLSIRARQLLDDAGFPNATIVASNDLDEYAVAELKQRGAQIGVWGIGTKMATAYDQPALGGVYKLAALRDDAGEWRYKVKLSEMAIKTSNPGIQQVRRFLVDGRAVADAIYDQLTGIRDHPVLVNTEGLDTEVALPDATDHLDLLEPVYRRGKRLGEVPSTQQARSRTLTQLSQFHPETIDPLTDRPYPVGLERRLFEIRQRLISSFDADRD